jgi:Ca2+-binding EF-hand superfamily protein
LIFQVQVLIFTYFRNAFSAFDTDNDGFITREELEHVLKQMGETEGVLTIISLCVCLAGQVTQAEVDTLLDEADTNKDNKIDIQEFVQVMSKKP